MSHIKKILVIVLCLTNFNAFADQQYLFKAIDPGKEQKLEEYNSRFIKASTFSARRYRIVRVNTKLLTSVNGEFLINPFDDVQLRVASKEILAHPGTHSLRWIGEIHDAHLIKDALQELTDSERQNISVDDIANAISQVRFYASSWDLDLDENKATLAFERKAGRVSPNESQDFVQSHKLQKNAFMSFRGSFTDIDTGNRYVLKPLKYTPKYHLIYEVDEDKRYATTDAHDTASLTEEDRRKAALHTEYLEKLPKEEAGKVVKGDVK